MRSLLIVGAGTYALLAYEIASDMKLFEKISFVDDNKTQSPIGDDIAGRIEDLQTISKHYTDMIVAIGNPEVRANLLERIKKETRLNIATLVSPRAYIAPSAEISEGVIVEPFAVIHTLCIIKKGCFISAGAVINHESICEECVHVDCNATVLGYSTVPAKTKVLSGMVYPKL